MNAMSRSMRVFVARIVIAVMRTMMSSRNALIISRILAHMAELFGSNTTNCVLYRVDSFR